MNGLARGATITLAARGFALIVGVASSIILARALGPSGRGIYALIVLIPALFQTAGGLGLEGAATFLVARNRERARPIAFTLVVSALGLGLALIAAYAGISRLEVYSRFLESAGLPPGLVWVLVLLLPVNLAALSVSGALLGLERYRSFNLATLITPTANLAILLAVVLLGDLDVAGAVFALAAANLIGLAVGIGLLAAVSQGRLRFVRAVVRQAVSYGLRVHAANVAWFLHYRADMFLVGYMAGPAALGYYAVAVGLAEKLYIPASAVGTVLFPRIAGDDPGTASGTTPAASRYTLWLTVALGAGLAAVAWPAIYVLYGADFLPSLSPLWLLLPGVVGLAVGRVLSADLNGRGLPGVVARANGSMALLNVALNLWWIPLWGAAGAAAATSISYSAAVALLAVRYRQVSGVAWSDLIVIRAADRAYAAGALRSLVDRRNGRPKAARESSR